MGKDQAGHQISFSSGVEIFLSGARVLMATQ
jgi:hypothetical protein